MDGTANERPRGKNKLKHLKNRKSVQLQCDEPELGLQHGLSFYPQREGGHCEFGAGEKHNLHEILGRSFWLLCGELSRRGKRTVWKP